MCKQLQPLHANFATSQEMQLPSTRPPWCCSEGPVTSPGGGKGTGLWAGRALWLRSRVCFFLGPAHAPWMALAAFPLSGPQWTRWPLNPLPLRSIKNLTVSSCGVLGPGSFPLRATSLSSIPGAALGLAMSRLSGRPSLSTLLDRNPAAEPRRCYDPLLRDQGKV